MAELTVADGVSLYYEDSDGDGRPVVLIHGFLGGVDAWADNVGPLTAAGYRVVAYERRGSGRSSLPTGGGDYDYDTLAGDLVSLLKHLDLRDAVLVGFSMGGGEVARYLGTGDRSRIAAAVFVSSITPCLEVKPGNPDGAMPLAGFQGMQDACRTDPEGFFAGFVRTFFSSPSGLKVGEATVDAAVAAAMAENHEVQSHNIGLWVTDFRADLADVGLPVLVVQGDGDQNVPFAASGARTAELIDGAQLEVVPDGPHGITVSHADIVNRALISFLDSLDEEG